MAILESSGETSQTEGEGDSPDKPPHGDISKKLESLNLSHPTSMSSSNTTTPANGTLTAQPSRNGGNGAQDTPHYPLPPPDSLLAGEKQPGMTRGALKKLSTSVPLSNSSSSSSEHHRHERQNSSGPHSPIHSASPVPTSPTDSYWDGPSAPPSRGPSRPPSQPASRAPSMSGGVSGGMISLLRERRGSSSGDAPPTPKSKPPSIKGEDNHKFTLKDLLASAPKLSRKSSQRSTSSKKSDADGDGKARSVTGGSTVSLTQKYGVCQKVAIGKGATSVVRLAHKWDRSEEKLYAIKVCLSIL